MHRRTTWLTLPHDQAALVDLEPQRARNGARPLRWLLLGPMPPSGIKPALRPTLAAGEFVVGADGSCRVDHGTASLESLEALASAWRRARGIR